LEAQQKQGYLIKNKDMAMTEEYTNPYQATLENTDIQSYFNPPKQGNTTTFTPHIEPLPPQEAVQSKPQLPSTKEYMDAIMGGFPEPTHPKASQERIERIMKTKALGQGLGALGDIFALSQGARVNRRQPDQSISRYRQLFESREDEYLRRMDDHARQQFNLKLQGLAYGIQRGDREQDIDFRERSQAFNETLRQDQLNSQEEYRKEQIRVRDDDRKVREAAEKRMDEQFKAQHGLSREQFEWQKTRTNDEFQSKMAIHAMKLQMDENKNAFNLYTKEGKLAAKVDPKGGVDALLAAILSDPDAKTEMDALKGQLGEALPIETKRYLVGKYWERSPDAMKWVEGNQGNTVQEKPKAGIPWNTGFSPTRPTGTPVAPAPAPRQQAPQQPVQQQQPATKPQAPAQMQLQKDDEQPVLPSAKEITSKYQGYDLTKQKPSSIAYDMAEKQGIPTNQRPAWIAAKAKEIQQDIAKMDTSNLMKNMGYDSSATEKTENIPSFFK